MKIILSNKENKTMFKKIALIGVGAAMAAAGFGGNALVRKACAKTGDDRAHNYFTVGNICGAATMGGVILLAMGVIRDDK